MGVDLKSFDLTKEMLRLSYRLVAETPPFCNWNLPDSHDVNFVVTRSRITSGHYKEWKRGRKFAGHEIGISNRCVGTLHNLIMIMAHEMIHLYQAISLPRTDHPNAEHNHAFLRFADQVTAYHHFDRRMFAEVD